MIIASSLYANHTTLNSHLYKMFAKHLFFYVFLSANVQNRDCRICIKLHFSVCLAPILPDNLQNISISSFDFRLNLQPISSYPSDPLDLETAVCFIPLQ